MSERGPRIAFIIVGGIVGIIAIVAWSPLLDVVKDAAACRGHRRCATCAAGKAPTAAQRYQVVIAEKQGILVDTHTGRAWALSTTQTPPLWMPVEFNPPRDGERVAPPTAPGGR